MAEQPVKQNNSDEIDLGQLFQMIGRGFNKLGIAFLRLFLYLKKNAFILGGLIVLGAGIGYGLNSVTESKMQIEVIVKPNLDSENYLYDVVNEIKNNIGFRDTVFFEEIGVPTENLGQFKILIEPVEQTKKADMEYLEFLEKFNGGDEFSDIIRNELLKNNSLNHRIVFSFKNPSEGQLFATKAMDYVNSTEYYKELTTITNNNAENRIELNGLIIKQIDDLIHKYTKGLDQEKGEQLEGRILLNNEELVDLTGLLELKNSLIENIERKKIELWKENQAIKIINFGRPKKVEKSFFGQRLVLMPTLFLLLFFGIQTIVYLNRKSSQLS